MSWIRVFSPATIGNIGPGFDVLGLAISGLGDTMEARLNSGKVTISEITGDAGTLPLDAAKNTAGIAALEVLKAAHSSAGVEIKIHKGIPAGSGLGSSAASACAAAFAVNHLLGNPLSKEKLVMPATIADSRVSGGFFADNTAPCLLGGATLTRCYEPLDIVRLGAISKLVLAVATPKYTLLTKDSRAVLPKTVPLENFVSNMANSCLIAAAFAKDDYDLFSRCINDKIIEPARAKLIPGFYDVKKAALDAGADGCTISGAGPTVFAITNDKKKGEAIGKAMSQAFSKNSLESSFIVTNCSAEGTKLL